MSRIAKVIAVALIAVWSLVVPSKAGPLAAPGLSISGSGIVNALDDFGSYFPDAGQFSIHAELRPDGTPYGALDLVGRGEFAAAWGACPYDPRCEDFPNTATKTLHLRGEVDSLIRVGNDVVASGLLVELDHGQGDGVIFEEHDVQFSVTAREGEQSLVFQFCLVPPFTFDFARGRLAVSAGDSSTSWFEAPAEQSGRAMPCQGQ